MPADRGKGLWKRLMQIYGSRVAESYGPEIPKPWAEAIDDLSDEQVAYGLRKVMRDTPIHPPALGQFVAACVDMPQKIPQQGGPSIQEQLCQYVMFTRFPADHDAKFSPDQMGQSSRRWTYLYREWIDDTRPKHSQRCAECTGVLIPGFGSLPGYRVTVAEMLADSKNYAKVRRYFEPQVMKEQDENFLTAIQIHADKLRGETV